MAPSPKKIIVCCDGTWQSSVSSQDNVPSNVTRLARHLACSGTDSEKQEWNQIVYYDSGVGTGDIGLQTVIQGGSGAGLDGNVIEAYNFIVLNYNKGDKIYCFGFSRGAYTARAVAGLVTDIGVIKARDMQEFPALYRQYQQNCKGDEFRKTQYYHNWVEGVKSQDQDPSVYQDQSVPKDFTGPRASLHPNAKPVNWDIRPHNVPDQETRWVEVVGVFDTVGSLGIPDIQGIDLSWLRQEYGFHNVKLSPFIKNAFHALALDERRGPFTPTLWYIPYEKDITSASTYSKSYMNDYTTQHSNAKTDAEKLEAFKKYIHAMDVETLQPMGDYQRLYQVWFPGMHINVGGGSDDILKNKKGDLEQIANITFCWMAEMLRPHLALDTDSMNMFRNQRQDALDRVLRMKNYGDGWMQSYLNHAMEYLHIKNVDTFKIDKDTLDGWATGDLEDSFAGVMRIAGAKVRHPGQCVDDRTKKPLSSLGKTWEFMHPCIEFRERTLKDKYNPESLKGYKRRDYMQDGKLAGWEYFRKGDGWDWDPKTKKAVQTDLKIPEWIIYPSKDEYNDRSFERSAMPYEAHEWVKTLDKVYQLNEWWKAFYGS